MYIAKCFFSERFPGNIEKCIILYYYIKEKIKYKKYNKIKRRENNDVQR